MKRPPLLGEHVVQSWLADHKQWHEEAGHLVREIATKDYASSVQILQAQVALAEGLVHHPIVTLGYRHVRFEVWTHDRNGLTQLDLSYATGLDALVASTFNDDLD